MGRLTWNKRAGGKKHEKHGIGIDVNATCQGERIGHEMAETVGYVLAIDEQAEETHGGDDGGKDHGLKDGICAFARNTWRGGEGAVKKVWRYIL
jgi:hypothetical protein